jgi:hypothetical protein
VQTKGPLIKPVDKKFMSSKNIEKIVEELALKIPFKDVNEVGEVVLVVKESRGHDCRINFGQVVKLSSEKVGPTEWWHVDLVFLTFPLSFGTFIVKTEDISGLSIFTCSGQKVFLKAVNTQSFLNYFGTPEKPDPDNSPPTGTDSPKLNLRLIK